MKSFRMLPLLAGLFACLLAPVVSQAATQRWLTNEERIVHSADLEVTITYADFDSLTATNQTKTIELFSVSTQVAVSLVKSVLVVPFKDASDAAFNTTLIEVGDGADTDRLLTSTQLNENGTEVLLKLGTGFYVYTATDTVDAKLTPMATKIGDELDTGKLRLYFKVFDHR